ncbi:unnamed protein product [Urochloa decumbens]|uniref:Uncharacterized protein n=1 Tax=Urochloa decumbens TaxID=240449 RepID=A0ABC9BJH4_9POAL
MATFPIKPLDGADGYLRWREMVLLGLNTASVVLSDDPPPAPSQAAVDGGTHQAAKKQWVHDDAVCRGYILAALSDRLLPVYMWHGTARALWEAVACTYELDYYSWELMFEELEFGDDETLRERVARAEALAIAKSSFPEPPSDQSVAYDVCTKLPDVAKDAIMRGYGTTMAGYTSMSGLWRSALEMERIRNTEASRFAMREKEEGSGKSGHVAKKRRR